MTSVKSFSPSFLMISVNGSPPCPSTDRQVFFDRTRAGRPLALLLSPSPGLRCLLHGCPASWHRLPSSSRICPPLNFPVIVAVESPSKRDGNRQRRTAVTPIVPGESSFSTPFVTITFDTDKLEGSDLVAGGGDVIASLRQHSYHLSCTHYGHCRGQHRCCEGWRPD